MRYSFCFDRWKAYIAFNSVSQLFQLFPAAPSRKLSQDAKATSHLGFPNSQEISGLITAAGILIADLSLLSEQLEKMAVCSKCRKGTLQLKMDSLGMGFASKLVLQCSNT